MFLLLNRSSICVFQCKDCGRFQFWVTSQEDLKLRKVNILKQTNPGNISNIGSISTCPRRADLSTLRFTSPSLFSSTPGHKYKDKDKYKHKWFLCLFPFKFCFFVFVNSLSSPDSGRWWIPDGVIWFWANVGLFCQFGHQSRTFAS